jgi:hypothetical protein
MSVPVTFRVAAIINGGVVFAWGLYRDSPSGPPELLAEFKTQAEAGAYADRLSDLVRDREGAHTKPL